jgi:hypothetical protein
MGCPKLKPEKSKGFQVDMGCPSLYFTVVATGSNHLFLLCISFHFTLINNILLRLYYFSLIKVIRTEKETLKGNNKMQDKTALRSTNSS